MSEPVKWECHLGHTRRAMECPACGEMAVPGWTAKLEHWRWYRGRTSSKRVRALVDAHLAALEGEPDA